MNNSLTNQPDRDLPLTPLEQRLIAGGAPAGTRASSKIRPASWRPFSLRWPYLCLLVLLSLSLLGAIEALRQVSQRRHGVYFLSKDVNATSLPLRLTLVYSYLPTILGVIYAILWSFVDFDSRRTEPYIQMRSPSAPASTLLLDYFFESAFVTPLRALRRRHWSLAAVTFTFLLISLVFPASQGALFGVDQVAYTLEDYSFQRSVGEEGATIVLKDTDYVIQAKAISLVDGPRLPVWTTLDHAITAFTPSEQNSRGNSTWTARTPISFATPKCRQFDVQDLVMIDGGGRGLVLNENSPLHLQHDLLLLFNVTISSPEPCYLSVSITVTLEVLKPRPNYVFAFWTKEFTSNVARKSDISAVQTSAPLPNTDNRYTLIQDSGLIDSIYWWNATESCSADPHLAGTLQLNLSGFDTRGNWSSSLSGIKAELIVFGCDCQYYSANGTVTADADDQAVLNVEQITDVRDVTSTFDAVNLETFFELGSFPPANPSTEDAARPGLWVLDHIAGLKDVALANLMSRSNSSNLFQSSPLESETVGQSFEAAWRLVYALTQRGFLEQYTGSQMIGGTLNVEAFAVVVVPAFAIMSEVILVLAVLVLLFLLLSYKRRTSILRSDPESVAAQCGMIADEFGELGILRSFSLGLERLCTKDLQERLRSSYLKYNERTGSLQIFTTEQQMVSLHASSAPTNTVLVGDPLPFFLTKRAIAISIATLGCLAIGMSFLVGWAVRVQGFQFLAGSLSFTSQLFWSFMPTLIATFLEAFWVTVHRDLSILETWVAIRKGHTFAHQSVSLQYSSRPPILVLVMSLKQKHFMLAFVSMLCVLTSVLNVTMAGLFLNSFQNVVSSADVTSSFTASTLPAYWFPDQYDFDEAFSVLNAELNNDGTPPRWTNDNRSFLPVNFDNVDLQHANQDDVFTATTTSVESSLVCRDFVFSSTSNEHGPGVFTESGGTQTLRYKPDNADPDFDYTCMTAYDFDYTLQSIYFRVMVVLNISSNSGILEAFDARCPDVLLFSVDVPSNTTSFYLCTPSISASGFEIQHDVNDQIVASKPANQSSLEGASMISNQTGFLNSYTAQLMEATQFSRTSTSLTTYDWLGVLMTRARSGGTGTTTSIPELAEDVWQRTFAIWFSLYRNDLLTSSQTASSTLVSDHHINARGTSNTTGNVKQPSFSLPTGTITTRQARLIPSIPAFVISICLLVLDLIGFIAVVFRRRHRYAGPRMPKTIGSIIPWVIHSRMLEDFEGVHYFGNRDRNTALKQMGQRYGFGRFVGTHGRVTLGIEHEDQLLARGAYGDF